MNIDQQDVINSSSNDATTKASYHDIHALPPQFVLDAYKHYNIIKRADLDTDTDVIDFRRGLTFAQRQQIRPTDTISADRIQTICDEYCQASTALSNHRQTQSAASVKDVTVYKHDEFPGLQIIPGLLPPQAQLAYISQIMHTCLADSRHKTNLHVKYDLDYPDEAAATSLSHRQRSLFSYNPTDIHTKAKDTEREPLNMAQYLSKRLRWLTIGAQYDWPTRSYSGQDPTEFPPDLAKLVAGFFSHIKPESGVCLLYGAKDYMPVHRDVSEQCERALASFSFGCDGVFLLARGEEDTDDVEERKKRIAVIRVHSGDCIHLSGESRWAWHAMARTLSNTCPDYLARWPLDTDITPADSVPFEKWKGFMSSKRLNVSCRQVWD